MKKGGISPSTFRNIHNIVQSPTVFYLVSGLVGCWVVHKFWSGAKRYLTDSVTAHESAISEFIVDPQDITDTFDSVGGLKEIKQQVMESVVWPFNHPSLFQSNGLNPPLGVLLYGPPGTGKTLLARAIAKKTNARFIEVRVESIVDKWLGESQKMAAALFTLAVKCQPAIIFIDELDSLLSSKSTCATTDVYQQIRAIFLRHWDGICGNLTANRVLVIGATNKAGDVDEAILRRFTVKIKVDPPVQSERADILKVMLRNDKTDLREQDYEWIARNTEKYTGADLKELCREARMCVLREAMGRAVKAIQTERFGPEDSVGVPTRPMQKSDFEAALKVVQPNTKFVEQNATYNNFSLPFNLGSM
eukprot:TRINITY_DN31077_c0_g1_i1.p1 TRINITY_DN31077_c0_g1~~TRINITY_DN31077_c0_g1_i1.p1  ORF type:complete len:362 (-),score=10.31 TRINITY_DN31077_c0_g1_i1:250-1335(-)